MPMSEMNGQLARAIIWGHESYIQHVSPMLSCKGQTLDACACALVHGHMIQYALGRHKTIFMCA